MIQEIHGQGHQVTQRGAIINCYGAPGCPLYRGSDPESTRQAEFARATGIWCPPGAREIFERLMESHDFTAPRLCTAWRANSLVWDERRQQMVSVTPWIEAAFGYAVMLLMVAYYALQGSQVLLAGTGWRGVFAFCAAGVLYLGMVWVVWRFLILPRRVAIRAQKALPDIVLPRAAKDATKATRIALVRQSVGQGESD